MYPLQCLTDSGPLFRHVDACGMGFQYRVGIGGYALGKDGFSGPVEVEVLDLPPGVAAQVTYYIYDYNTREWRFRPVLDDISPSGYFNIKITATEDAPLGPLVATARWSSSSKAYTASVPLEIVDGQVVLTCTEDGRICAGG